MTRLALASLLAIAATFALGTPSASATTIWEAATVIRWVDGDTVVTSAGRVRLIGVDTPEVGKCGAKHATSIAQRLAPAGSQIRLGNPSSVVNADRYGRLLRYVDTRVGRDIAARQIKAGARARYDGRDGYDWHPRQAKYRALDRAHLNYCPKPRKSSHSNSPSSNDNHSSSGSGSSYNGPRCYEPGGKVWHPC